MLVPLLAFDRRGQRLGYGGGYYDRSFAFLNEQARPTEPLLVGIGYDFQELDEIEPARWDVRLDFIATDRELIDCTPAPAGQRDARMSPCSRMHQHWLMKSEPDTFSIDDLPSAAVEPWDGVRNYQARNFMRDGMRPGDGVFFYHSNCAEPGIVGLAEVASDAYPDPSQFDPKSDYFDAGSTRDNPRWLLVEVKFVRKLKRTITPEGTPGNAGAGRHGRWCARATGCR